jgi:hypothetical protein
MTGETAIVAAELTEIEARTLTDRIKQTTDQLWRLLLEAHERKAWAALGYQSWRHYALNEFNMGQSHAYRLLDQGRVIRALEQAAGSPVGEIVTERLARDLKPRIELVTDEIETRIAAGEESIDVVSNVISKARTTSYVTSRKRADRPNRCLESLTLWLSALDIDALDGDYVGRLDADLVPEWITEIRSGAQKLLRLAAQLERGRR